MVGKGTREFIIGWRRKDPLLGIGGSGLEYPDYQLGTFPMTPRNESRQGELGPWVYE